MRLELLSYADTPPSLNQVGSRGALFAFHRAKRKWQVTLEELLMLSKVPRPSKRITVKAVLRFPVRRDRDEGNYRSLLEKALGDALVNGGWLVDDTPEQFRFPELTFESELGPRRTKLLLWIE